MAPSWWRIIIVSHICSKPEPCMPSTSAISSGLIIPGMSPMSMPSMPPCRGSSRGHARSPGRVGPSPSASRPSARSRGPGRSRICSVSASNSGVRERPRVMSTISSAWAWCGIISVAKATSASLNSADAGIDDAARRSRRRSSAGERRPPGRRAGGGLCASDASGWWVSGAAQRSWRTSKVAAGWAIASWAATSAISRVPAARVASRTAKTEEVVAASACAGDPVVCRWAR